MANTIRIEYWQPDQVRKHLAFGSAHYVGIVDDNTVLKYPHIKGDLDGIRVEARRYALLGPHPHLVDFKGLTEDGILLERGAQDISSFLTDATYADRLRLCMQAVKTVLFFHSKRYIYCDIKVDNMLIDSNGNLKFCDLEGQAFNEDGSIAISGSGFEDVKARWPEADADERSPKTDIFALGTAMYHFIHGHQPFPNLNKSFEDDDDDEIQARFKRLELPDLPTTEIGKAIRKCWAGMYSSADEILKDIEGSGSSG